MIQQTFNENFGEWLTSHRDIATIFTSLSMFNVEILNILILVLNAPIDREARRRIFIASFLLKDLQKITILVSESF
jgi:hypothetical protein